MKFRNDISLLRAISVLAVLFFHFKLRYFSGGFIGVDIFFVISGYLMTRIVLSGFKNDNFDLLSFYKKRVVRIFPALLAMISFFALIIGLLIPTQIINYLKYFYSSSLFFSNIFYYLNSNYFDTASQFNFLLHTWSLSVEWQFYMIYPLILMLIRKFYVNNKNKFILFFCLMIIISLISMLLHSKADRSFSFFMFYPRAWEMMFGGLAFLFEGRFKKINLNLKKVILALCLLVIFSCIYLIKEYKVVWPSLLTIIPVVSTAIILLINIDLKFFNNKLVRFVGDISYSLYLWHWPFWVISMYFALNDRLRYKVLFICLSFIFAIISYYSIEKKTSDNKIKPILITSFILFTVSFIVTKLYKELPANNYMKNLIFCASDYKYSEEATKQYNFIKGHKNGEDRFNEYDLSNLKIKKDSVVILLGDSHAGMMSEMIEEIIDKDKYQFIQVTTDATYPMIDSKTNFEGPREFFNYFFVDYFPKIKDKVKLVIINSNYSGYPIKDLALKIDFSQKYFAQYNVDTVYLGQTDTYYFDYPTTDYLEQRYSIHQPLNLELSRKNNQVNLFLEDHLKNKYINLLNVSIQKVNKSGIPYMYDTHHLTSYGCDQYKDIIKEKLNEYLQ
ncbi:hypothetical protein ACM39_17325 [Chryseobacterium sp. FH2]|uniref:acyltransferase family protein n=1 Tax=Chryseobacterium sp. FH2 TaxID=1674291 RepID=UPI00065AF728|nr:acyltransferase family protein [Chryseobacterium sp. FH2]KMQ62880.1 hypothetical protein ACM39_17325 [Chryseobacterium sp. FH2]